jgi:hypothetical protein
MVRARDRKTSRQLAAESGPPKSTTVTIAPHFDIGPQPPIHRPPRPRPPPPTAAPRPPSRPHHRHCQTSAFINGIFRSSRRRKDCPNSNQHPRPPKRPPPGTSTPRPCLCPLPAAGSAALAGPFCIAAGLSSQLEGAVARPPSVVRPPPSSTRNSTCTPSARLLRVGFGSLRGSQVQRSTFARLASHRFAPPSLVAVD